MAYSGTPEEIRAKKRAYNQTWHRANREKNNAISLAYRQAHLEECRTKSRAWHAAHRAEDAVKRQNRKLANPQKYKEQEHAQYMANREKRLLKSRKQYEANPEKHAALCRAWSKAHLPEIRIRNNAWYHAHPEVQKRHARLRYSRKRGLPTNFTLADETFCRAYFHYACAICGNEEGFQWTIALDHWIPIASTDCPGTIPTNMVPLCHGIGGCNNSKRHREPREWLVQRFGTMRAQQILKKIHAYFAAVTARQLSL